MVLSWAAPVASGARLARFLPVSCSSNNLFLRRTRLQVPFWRRPGRLWQPFGKSGVVFFHCFSWFSVHVRARGNNAQIVRKPQFLLCGTCMALMASKLPTCTSLAAAFCEKHFSCGEPCQRFQSASGVPSGEDLGLSWPCLGELLGALGRFLAALGLPGRPLGRLCAPFCAVLSHCGGFRASPARLQRRFGAFWRKPRLDFLCVPSCFGEHFGPQALDGAVAWLTASPLRRSSPVVCFCSIIGVLHKWK